MEPPLFGKKAGEPVPQVDPGDIKAVWDVLDDVARRHPGEQVGIEKGFFERACKPGADIDAVLYRAGMLRIFLKHGDENLIPWMDNGEPCEALWGAVAQIPMDWIGVDVDHEGFSFGVDDLLRRLQGAN